MAGWLDGQVSGQVDAWVAGWTSEWAGRCLGGQQVDGAEGRALSHRCGRDGGKSSFYNSHSKELFNKTHPLIINIKGEFDEEQDTCVVSKSLLQIACLLKRKT